MLLSVMLTNRIKVKDSLTPEDELCLMEKTTASWVGASSWVVSQGHQQAQVQNGVHINESALRLLANVRPCFANE